MIHCVVSVTHAVRRFAASGVRHAVRRIRRVGAAVVARPAFKITCFVVPGAAAAGGLGWLGHRIWEEGAALGPASLAQPLPVSSGLMGLPPEALIRVAETPQAVPEPATWVMFGSALLLFLFANWLHQQWRRQRA